MDDAPHDVEASDLRDLTGRRRAVMMTPSQFSELMDSHRDIAVGHVELRKEVGAIKVTLNEHVIALTDHVSGEKRWQDDVLKELKANTEITKGIRDAATFARVGGWLVSRGTAILLGSVALLVAVKSIFVSGDHSVIEWLRDLWGGGPPK